MELAIPKDVLVEFVVFKDVVMAKAVTAVLIVKILGIVLSLPRTLS